MKPDSHAGSAGRHENDAVRVYSQFLGPESDPTRDKLSQSGSGCWHKTTKAGRGTER